MIKSTHTVAVVDDDDSTRMSVERLLMAHAFLTRTYASGEAFLEAFAATNLCCAIIDIKLDGMSGIDVRRRLREQGSQLPVIFITGTDDQRLRLEAIASGCVDLLSKPFSAKSLLTAIGKALAG